MASEVDSLKESLGAVKADCGRSYLREERIHRDNQAAKVKLDASAKEHYLLLRQLKELLAEKETLKEIVENRGNSHEVSV